MTEEICSSVKSETHPNTDMIQYDMKCFIVRPKSDRSPVHSVTQKVAKDAKDGKRQRRTSERQRMR